jgi:hypothetical protein
MINTIYVHRVNSLEQLKSIPKQYGLEIDLRSEGKEVILQHDPFKKGEKLEMFLENYSHKGLILNSKTEGMETRVLEIMNSFNIKNFFFLDLSIPFLIKTYESGSKKTAIRFSEHEPYEFTKKFNNKSDWVWVDSFSGNYFSPEQLQDLSRFFKICLVSPELRGFDTNIIKELKTRYKKINIEAVCTKNPELWKK